MDMLAPTDSTTPVTVWVKVIEGDFKAGDKYLVYGGLTMSRMDEALKDLVTKTKSKLNVTDNAEVIVKAEFIY